MKKIEEAAAKRYDSFPWECQRKAFLAGARYVLDAMTSKVALRVSSRAATVATPASTAVSPSDFLAAVRKEIEG